LELYLETYEPIYDSVPGVTYVENHIFKEMHVVSELARTKGIKYGYVIIPTNSKTLYHDEHKVHSQNSGSLESVLITYRLKYLDSSCMQAVGTSAILGIGPRFYRWSLESDGEPWTGVMHPTGYLETKLPACKYRIDYFYTYQGLNVDSLKLAYLDFEILSDNEVIMIDPDSLMMEPGANEHNYNLLVETMKSLPSYQNLGGQLNPSSTDLVCTDSDNRNEFDIKGITIGVLREGQSSDSYEDYCEGDRLWEYSCDTSNYVLATPHICEHGCGEGICLDQQENETNHNETNESNQNGNGNNYQDLRCLDVEGQICIEVPCNQYQECIVGEGFCSEGLYCCWG